MRLEGQTLRRADDRGSGQRPRALVALALELGNRADLITEPLRGHGADRGRAPRAPRSRPPAAPPGGAPLDHVNNLGWTALMEAVVLGDGGARPRCDGARSLLAAGADPTIADRGGRDTARSRRSDEGSGADRGAACGQARLSGSRPVRAVRASPSSQVATIAPAAPRAPVGVAREIEPLPEPDLRHQDEDHHGRARSACRRAGVVRASPRRGRAR